MTELDINRLRKRVDREKRARAEAERLLEEKSLSLYRANQDLEFAHEEQKRAAEDLKAILDNMPRGILITDASGTVEAINFLAVQMFGVTQKMAAGQNIRNFLPSLSDLADPAQVEAAIDAGDLQINGVRADKSEFRIELAFTTVSKGEDTRVVWMVRDITQRLAAEAERRQLEESLRQAQKLESLGTLAGGIAHELNTPIQFVTDNMNFLSDTVTDLMAAIKELEVLVPANKKEEISEKYDVEYLSEEAPQAIEQSVEGLKRIADIVLAVKKFSHPSSSGKEMNDLNDIIRTTATVSKNQWKYVADLDLQLDESLPNVMSNAGELNQVFLNLIVNAAHAIEDRGDSGESGQIRIRTALNAGAVECRVSDNGSGMPNDIASKVFDPFFTTKDPGRGTGQGLSIVHSIVTQSHGGEISVETEQGKGTDFILTFPLDASQTEAA